MVARKKAVNFVPSIGKQRARGCATRGNPPFRHPRGRRKTRTHKPKQNASTTTKQHAGARVAPKKQFSSSRGTVRMCVHFYGLRLPSAPRPVSQWHHETLRRNPFDRIRRSRLRAGQVFPRSYGTHRE
ncbi:hypothetical protein ZHAS_00008902 [Anopheles sinensis]|uniref:Uncharacterized protein n=1 Tax=Anopheles sinensis TaxID=74873 RepID=A0A084VTL3_ANOSI|nr:hypothetical protein ZHAS_00008902 [Anopheles sinensis]